MDITQTNLNCVEWFFGYGGNHLGIKRVEPGLRTIAACEIEAYAVANMVAKMEAGLLDPFPVWTDCKTFPCEIFRGLVDLFVASYPCQGFSAAGKREGIEDPRFLWPWVIRAVVIIRPWRVFFENVAGHVSLGLSTVISDLEGAGYRTTWGIFSASEVGAPHERKRVFIMGDSTGSRFARRQDARADRGDAGTLGSGRQESERASSELAHAPSLGEREPHDTPCAEPREWARENAGGGSEQLAVASRAGLEERRNGTGGAGSQQPVFAGGSGDRWPARPGELQYDWEALRVVRVNLDVLEISERHNVDFDFALRTLQRFLKRGVGGATDGFAAEMANYAEWLKLRVDALRLCGNGVVPATAELAYRTLSARLK